MSEEKVTKEKKPKSKVRKVLEWVFTGVFAGLFLLFAAGQIDGMIHKKDNYGQTVTFGYAYFVITTDSMEPEYPANKTAIITKKISAEKIAEKFDNNEVVDITFVGRYYENGQTYNYVDYRPGNISYGGIDYKLEGNNPVYPDKNTPITHRLIEYHLEEDKPLGEGRYTFVVAGINTGGSYAKEGQYQLLTENELLGIVKVNSKVLGGLFKFITSPWGLLVFLLVPAFYLVVTSVLDIFKAMKEPDEESADEDKPKSSGNASLEGISDKDKERLKQELLEQMLNKKKGDNNGK